MFLSVDGTAIVQLINFAIFFAILNVVFLRPVGAAIRKRRAYIDSVQSDYDAYSRQVRELRTEAEAKRAAARREADETLVKVRTQSDNEAAAQVAEVTERASAIAEEARKAVDAELAGARAKEDDLSKALAATLVERAIGNIR
jgi:F0F1-type ATP synthase membrane subunit b/b'